MRSWKKITFRNLKIVFAYNIYRERYVCTMHAQALVDFRWNASWETLFVLKAMTVWKVENLVCISSAMPLNLSFISFQNGRHIIFKINNKSFENFIGASFVRASVIIGRRIYLAPPSGLTRNFPRNFRRQRNITPLYKLCESVGYVVRGRHAVSRTANFRVCSTIASSR